MNTPSLEIVEEIKKKVPSGIKLIDFFTEILPMKKEAAYRRLRGEIPLTLEEARQIAIRLNLSLDKLLRIKEEGSYISTITRMNGQNIMEAYSKTMAQKISALKLMKMDPHAAIYAAINVLPISYAFLYPTVSKFRFLKWAYQFRNRLNPPKLSEIIIPSEVRHLEAIYSEEHAQIATHYIWIRELLKYYLNDIRYFAEMDLVNQEEIRLLIDETYQLLNDLERDASAGETEAGVSLLIYLANTYFDSNYIYVEGNGFTASSINVFGINYYSSTDKDISNDTKEWIESLMRYSTLISKSGEIERVTFFNRQRKLIEESNLCSLYGI